MNMMKKTIIFLLSVSLVLSSGCVPKPSFHNNQVSSNPSGVIQEEAPESIASRMGFLLPPGEENSANLQKATEICAAENEIDLASYESVNRELNVAGVMDFLGAVATVLWVITLPAQILTLDSMMLTGPPGFSDMHGTIYETKMKPYIMMQKCMEQRGYVCEGSCFDSKPSYEGLEKCLETSMSPDWCYEREQARQKMEAKATQSIPLPKDCGDNQGINVTYLAFNIWVSYKDLQYAVNYKEGKILLAGTEVLSPTMDEVKRTISFTVKDTCEKISVEFVPWKHPGKTIGDYYNFMFTDKDFGELTGWFREEEVEAIREGRLIEGMSKQAVLIAYGYPLEIYTPDYESNQTWKYQSNPHLIQTISFNNNDALSKDSLGEPCWNNERYSPGLVTNVIDGDSFYFKCNNGRGDLFHLSAIDAPELDQPFGTDAKGYATDFISGGKVYLKIIGQQPDHGFLRVDNNILNRQMIENGYARKTEVCHDVCDEYLRSEEEAKKNGVGMWVGYKKLVFADNRDLEKCLETSMVPDRCYEEEDKRKMSNNTVPQGQMARLQKLKDVLNEFDQCAEKAAKAYYERHDCMNHYLGKIVKLVPYERAEKIKRINQTYCRNGDLNLADMIDCIDRQFENLNKEVYMIKRCIYPVPEESGQQDEECSDFL